MLLKIFVHMSLCKDENRYLIIQESYYLFLIHANKNEQTLLRNVYNINSVTANDYCYSPFIITATIEYSCPSVCLSVCCLSVCLCLSVYTISPK